MLENMSNEEKMLLAAGGLVGMFLLFGKKKTSGTASDAEATAFNANASNAGSPIYVPTTENNYHTVYGNETTTNTDDRNYSTPSTTTNSNNTASGGASLTLPPQVIQTVIPTTPVVTPSKSTPIVAPAPKAPTYKTYTIKKGDTLFSLGGHTMAGANSLAKLNGISNPNKIKVGQTIKIPV